MAASGTVAVLLPGAFYFLRETKLPPLDLLRQHGVPIALATDANPGTSPILSLQLMLQMGATLFHMTPEECLQGVTAHAAQALGLNDVVVLLKVYVQICVYGIVQTQLNSRISLAPIAYSAAGIKVYVVESHVVEDRASKRALTH